MKSKVKYMGSAPSNPQKAVDYADIKDQAVFLTEKQQKRRWPGTL